MVNITVSTRRAVVVTLILLALVAIVLAVLTFRKGNLLFVVFDCLVAIISCFALSAILKGRS